MSDLGLFIEFIEQMQEVKKRMGLLPHQEPFYRGHENTCYTLLPSLFRRQEEPSQDYWQLERRIFFEFRNRARYLYNAEHDDWDVLFHMQHHGVPTRLLDWTTVFGVALHFALLNYPEMAQVPCIWVLNPYELNYSSSWGQHRIYSPKYLARVEDQDRSYDYGELLLGAHPPHWHNTLDWDSPLAIYSLQRSERMFAQSGCFTIHGLDMRPLDEIRKDPKILQKVNLPKEMIPGAVQFLELAGISHRQLFPDLDGLARSVCKQFDLRKTR